LRYRYNNKNNSKIDIRSMNLEFNKIFAAILVAGITGGTAAFISEIVMHPHHLEEDAVPIEGVESVGGGAAAGPTGPEPILDLIAMADAARGEKLSKACTACHSFDKGGAAKIGPNLWEIVGADKAHSAGFAYSDALSGMEGNWSYASLNKFLYKPKDYIPGTKMNYLGIKDPEDRAAMIAWLRTLAASPATLPSDAEIAAEQAELGVEEETEEEGEILPTSPEEQTSGDDPAALTPVAGEDIPHPDSVQEEETPAAQEDHSEE
jgi:cytochrome c